MSRDPGSEGTTPIAGDPAAWWPGRRWASTIGRTLSRNLVLVTAVLVLLLHVGNALLVVRFDSTTADREAEAREAEATLLAEHASRAVTAISLSLESIREKLPSDFATLPPSILTQVVIEAHMHDLPQVRAFIVLDASGEVIYDTRQFPASPRNLADRAYFAEQKSGHAMGLYIDGRSTARADKKPFFGVSVAVLDAQGRFGGVITALADPHYFASVYGTRGLEPEVTAILARDDGAILAGTSPKGTDGVLPRRVSEVLTDKHATVITRPVPSLPLQIVLAGPSPSDSPAFQSFLRADGIVMLAVTAVALLLARILALEAAARGRAETRLRDTIENVPAGIALFDADDRLALWNERYRLMASEPLRRLLAPGVAFDDIVAAAAPLAAADAIVEAPDQYVVRRTESHRAAQGEVVQKLPGGPWVLTRDRRTKDGGVVICHTDIMQIKQKEEELQRSEQAERVARQHAERADQAKSAFLATMSHELRTPLNAVIGFSEIIAQEMFGPVSARYREYNALILRSGRHLLAVINDILDVAKLQSGKTELHLASAQIAEIIEDVLRIMTKQAEAGGIALHAAIEPDLPPIVVDATRLRQVLLNLLSNAIKFTPAQGQITVTARREPAALRIEVRDTGIGMAEQDIPKALEPFGQIDNTMTRTREGTGLGVPLAKSLVELHGGIFEIASAPGLGTTVAVTLPAPAAAAPPLSLPRRNVG